MPCFGYTDITHPYSSVEKHSVLYTFDHARSSFLVMPSDMFDFCCCYCVDTCRLLLYLRQADKAVSSRSLFDAIQDTEAFVAANDESIMVVFRGTSELTDWATNLSISRRRVPKEWGLVGEGCDVHEVIRLTSSTC